MDEEARGSGGLEPESDRARQGRVRRNRRPYGYSQGAHHGAGEGESGRATYAALDLGTNNCRLLVARPAGEGFRVVDAFSRIIRLGEGITASGRISDAAIARAVGALAICRDKLRHRNVGRARLIATEACRSAVNGAEFQAMISAEVGLDLEIVDRETEATLAATGCTPLIDREVDGVLLFDIGGGSSELVRLGRCEPTKRGPPKPRIEGWISLPFGVVNLAERHGGVHVTRAVFETMVNEVSAAIGDFASAHRGDLKRMHMLGTSGTVTTLAGIHLELPRYDRRRVDGCWLNAHQAVSITDRLIAMTYEQRVANPCIGAERADLVLAGCAILEAIRRAFPCERLRVADRGLREGILVQMMRADGVWGTP